MQHPEKINLKGLNEAETEAWVLELGMESYRARQIRQWLFKKLVGSFDEMTNISASRRALLQEKADISPLKLVDRLESTDTTAKYLFKCRDGNLIESVLIPEKDHLTLCISSQAGCSMGCRFCLTARQGLIRNLTPDEIIEQIILVKRSISTPDRITNIVFMGMGEPLANYDAVIKTAGNLIAEDAMNFSHRKVTLSTCGLVPQIDRLGKEIPVNLAISLNAPDNRKRDYLMPINKVYPIELLLSACKDFPLPNRGMLTFEYILIDGINDTDEDALKLCKILNGLRAKINLIPLNPHPGSDMSPSPQERIHAFQDILIRNHYTAIIRKSKGRDILAACGQLSGKYMQASTDDRVSFLSKSTV